MNILVPGNEIGDSGANDLAKAIKNNDVLTTLNIRGKYEDGKCACMKCRARVLVGGRCHTPVNSLSLSLCSPPA